MSLLADVITQNLDSFSEVRQKEIKLTTSSIFPDNETRISGIRANESLPHLQLLHLEGRRLRGQGARRQAQGERREKDVAEPPLLAPLQARLLQRGRRAHPQDGQRAVQPEDAPLQLVGPDRHAGGL